MTFSLIELLTTLIQRRNVQEVVKQGLVLLIATVAAYCLTEAGDEPEYRHDDRYFLYDKTQQFWKQRRVRNQCLELLGSLIENLGDAAVSAVLQTVDGLVCGSSALPFLASADKHKQREVGMLLVGYFTEDI